MGPCRDVIRLSETGHVNGGICHDSLPPWACVVTNLVGVVTSLSESRPQRHRRHQVAAETRTAIKFDGGPGSGGRSGPRRDVTRLSETSHVSGGTCHDTPPPRACVVTNQGGDVNSLSESSHVTTGGGRERATTDAGHARAIH